MATKAKAVVITGWDASRGWASDDPSYAVLLKRLEPICTMRGTELKRLVRQIRQRKPLMISLKDNADTQSVMSYLEAYGAKVEAKP